MRASIFRSAVDGSRECYCAAMRNRGMSGALGRRRRLLLVRLSLSSNRCRLDFCASSVGLSRKRCLAFSGGRHPDTQLPSRFEVRGIFCRHRYGYRCSRVASNSWRPVVCSERSKTSYFHATVVAVGQPLCHRTQNNRNHCGGIADSQMAIVGCESCNEVRFRHGGQRRASDD